MKRLAGFLLLVVMLIAAGCGGGGDSGEASGSVKVTNNAPTSINYMYVSPASQNSWGTDQLGTSVIPPGGSMTLTDVPPGIYDIKVVMSSGYSYTLYGFEVVAGQTTLLNNPSQNWRIAATPEPVVEGAKAAPVANDVTVTYVTSTEQGELKK